MRGDPRLALAPSDGGGGASPVKGGGERRHAWGPGGGTPAGASPRGAGRAPVGFALPLSPLSSCAPESPRAVRGRAGGLLDEDVDVPDENVIKWLLMRIYLSPARRGSVHRATGDRNYSRLLVPVARAFAQMHAEVCRSSGALVHRAYNTRVNNACNCSAPRRSLLWPPAS